ncbi:MAG: hypothetical protein HDT38_07345, partial [Clostridiales bacterium]|nr:hypothetical protein [Clostridiales bacterium]
MAHQLQNYSKQPAEEDMRQIEFGYLPVLPQAAPADANELYEAFDSDLAVSEKMYAGHRFEVVGVASKVGPDVHNKPSIELSDETGGKCFVLCVFNSEEFYGRVTAGE